MPTPIIPISPLGPVCMMLGSTRKALHETLYVSFRRLQMPSLSTIYVRDTCRCKYRSSSNHRHLGELSSYQHG